MMKEKKYINKSIKTEPGQNNKKYTQLIKSGMQSLLTYKFNSNKNILFSNYENNS